MEIKAKEIKIVDIDSIIPNPKNNNIHNQKQKEQLKKIIKVNGFRSPLTVSNRSGFLVKGHLRLEAARELKMEKLPVIFQDYDSEALEFADLTADNAIAKQSELDLDMIKLELDNLKEIDIEILGLENFQILDFANEESDDEEFEDDKSKKFLLQVELPNEMELRDLFDDLENKGYMVKEV